MKHARKRNNKNKESVEIEKPTEQSVSSAQSPSEEEYSSNVNFGKRPILSNSAKYKEEPEIESTEQTEAADFGKLLLNDQSGSHFMFKSERNWQNSVDSTAEELPLQYFNLNIRELTKNILSIPFYERHQYSKNLFNPRELEDFDKKALKNQNTSKSKEIEIVQEKPIIPTFKEETKVLKTVEKPIKLPEKSKTEIKASTATSSNDRIIESDDELDTILRLTMNSQNSNEINKNITVETYIKIEPNKVMVESNQIADSNSTVCKSKIKEDMQQWLDDILDD